MSNEDIMDKPIGDIEKKTLEAKNVLVAGTFIEDIQGKKGSKNEGKVVGQKLVILCKHPDKEEPIKISTSRFIRGKAVTTSTIWVNADEEGNIQKGSTVALILEKYGVNSIKELIGKEVETEFDNEFLVIKGY